MEYAGNSLHQTHHSLPQGLAERNHQIQLPQDPSLPFQESA